jgi:hypothetical protein
LLSKRGIVKDGRLDRRYSVTQDPLQTPLLAPR